MTDTMLIAMARLISTPRTVSTGMRTTPPPMPAMAPTRPATEETKRRSASDTGEGSEREARTQPEHVHRHLRLAILLQLLRDVDGLREHPIPDQGGHRDLHDEA